MEWLALGSAFGLIMVGWTLGWYMREGRVMKSQQKLDRMGDLHRRQVSEAAEKCAKRIHDLGAANWADLGIVTERHDAALRSLESLVRVAQWWPERVDL